MKKILPILAVFMLLFTIHQALAVVVTDYPGFTYGSSTSTSACIGMIIINNASYDIRLLQVNKTTDSGATDWFIYEGKEKEIGGATRCLTGMNASKLMVRGKFDGTLGNVSAINSSLILKAGENYTLASDGNGSSVTFAYSADSYPMTGSSGKIIWEQGMDSNSFDEYKRVFTAISFSNLSCENDYECGTCQTCNAGTCTNQTNAQDLKNECTETASCTNAYTYAYTNGLCNGLGSCTSAVDNNVTTGNVCINSTSYDVNPTSGVNCAVWYDCVTNYTTANEYLTGYIGDGTSSCTATDWQYTGNNYTTPSGYGINETSQGLNCSITLLPECSINADCGLCEWCNGTICQNQTTSQDLKNECDANYNCVNPYTYSDGTDFCSGVGSCASTQNFNVTQGNVCINSTSYDVDPQSQGYCAIYYDCITNMTTADEYYTGYEGDGTPICTIFDWQLTGGSFTAPGGSYINTTSQGLNCTIYTPPTPAGLFTYNENDVAPSIIDAIGGFLTGLTKTALIIGLIAGLVLFVYIFAKGTEKLAPINRRK